MFWERLVRRFRRGARAFDPAVLQTAGGNGASMPAPPRRRVHVAWIVLIAMGVALVLLLSQSGHTQGVDVALNLVR